MKKTTKIILSIITVLLVAVCIVLKVYWSEILSILPKTPVQTENTQVTLIAHRGFSSVAPANTLAAIKEAADAKYYGVEFDIRLTADNEWVVIHDDSVKSMTDGNNKISQMTLSEVKELNITKGYGKNKYPNEKIPTLDEALEQCKNSNIVPIIEIKLNSDQTPDYTKLSRIIDSFDFDKLIIISFNKDAVIQMKKELSNAEYWLIISKLSDENINFCIENKIDGIDFDANRSENLKYINKIFDADIKACAWTVDSTKTMAKLIDMGVTNITTNTIYK